MKKIKNKPFFVFCLSVLFFSCSIEKRVHLPGYHVEWKNRAIDRMERPLKTPDEEKNICTNQQINKADDLEATSNINVATEEESNKIGTNNDVKTVKAISVLKQAIPGENKMRESIPVNVSREKGPNVGVSNPKSNSTIHAAKSNGIGRGVLFLVVALLFLGLGFLFFILLGVFGIILFIIFGIAALIYLIAGIIIMIAA